MQPFIVNDGKMREPFQESPGKNSRTLVTYRPGGVIYFHILKTATGRAAAAADPDLDFVHRIIIEVHFFVYSIFKLFWLDIKLLFYILWIKLKK